MRSRRDNGKLLWRASAQQRLGKRGQFYSTPAAAYGRVYIGGTDGKVYSFGATTGKLRWSHSTGGYVYGSPAIWRSLVLIGSYSRRFYAFDAATGKVRWQFRANGRISGSATVVERDRLLLDAERANLRRSTPAPVKLVWQFADGKYTPRRRGPEARRPDRATTACTHSTSDEQPTVVLGVSRSGTTLLKAMLDAHSQLAIPSESYFLPQLWDRHGERPERDAFVEDLGRLERLREWGVDPEDVRARLPERPTFAEAIQRSTGSTPSRRGKSRFGDKTPLYLQHLDVLERAFPGARYVHIVRDGRDAAVSLLAMTRKPRFNLARPRGVGDFAVAWRREVRAAQEFGRTHPYHELRYEDLVDQPEARLREVCAFLASSTSRACSSTTAARTPRSTPTTRASRNRRSATRAPGAGSCGPPTRSSSRRSRATSSPSWVTSARIPGRGAAARALAERGAYSTRLAVWSKALPFVRKSPLWRARQVYIRRSR